MQKVERWRIKQLESNLKDIASLLLKFGHPEWANVFLHYAEEAQGIYLARRFPVWQLKNLIRNIRFCFKQSSSLFNIPLQVIHNGRQSQKEIELVAEFHSLFHLLAELEEKLKEKIH
ncbi:MAG: hypothetical protein DRJ11_07000 [Candidatus Aminicenantes bacterium]|nr:hypothetical protein [Candidatus Aminicenantes bacterium]RLE02512.1 MAG: hypothetical protein DRJ11_07000 [Candidatus Aminicenantes bacterium]HHF42598.1 hypothetical protein [Candidatus Aminicenantes bacterium]